MFALLIFALDYGLTRYGEYRERVKREREMARFNMAAFKGARQTDWWLL